MYSLKKLFSTALSIIFFCIVFILGVNFFIKDLITHDNIYNALNKIDYVSDIKKTIEDNTSISGELLEYIEVTDIANHYVSDKILYEFNITNQKPKIDLELLNKRIAEGIEEFIDAKLDWYSGGLNSFLIDNGIDLKLKDLIEKYVSDKTSIDLVNDKILNEKDLDGIYKEVDKAFQEIKTKSEVKTIINIMDILYNDGITIILFISIIVVFIIISVINFNVLTGVLYTIVPFGANALIYLIGFFGLDSLKFAGGVEAEILNDLKNMASVNSSKYLFIFSGLTILFIFIYNIGKKINIVIAHKTGKTTLDTIFDDYDSEQVVKELQEKDKK